MEYLHGFPIVNAVNAFDVLAELGIRPWPVSLPAVSLEDYLKRDLDDTQRAELRFAPKTEVVTLTDHRGQPFRGFRSVSNNWATTFALIDGYVVIAGEYEHGIDQVVLVPPSGAPNREDRATENPMQTCAEREFEEETGLKLATIEPLSDQPLVVSGRQFTQCYSPFLGHLAHPVIKRPSKLDTTEQIQIVLCSLREWLKLIAIGQGIEDCGASATLLALNRLGKIVV